MPISHRTLDTTSPGAKNAYCVRVLKKSYGDAGEGGGAADWGESDLSHRRRLVSEVVVVGAQVILPE